MFLIYFSQRFIAHNKTFYFLFQIHSNTSTANGVHHQHPRRIETIKNHPQKPRAPHQARTFTGTRPKQPPTQTCCCRVQTSQQIWWLSHVYHQITPKSSLLRAQQTKFRRRTEQKTSCWFQKQWKTSENLPLEHTRHQKDSSVQK